MSFGHKFKIPESLDIEIAECCILLYIVMSV